MANELKFGNKVVFLNGHPVTLPTAASDPGSAVNGDMYYNTASNSVRIYEAGAWASLVATEGAQTINGVKTFGSAPNLSSLTASTPLKLDASKNIISADIDLTADVSGILPVANGGTNSSTALSNDRVMKSSGGAIVEAAAITASRALISDANGIPTHSSVTSSELAHLSGSSSNIQDQLDDKADLVDLASNADGVSGASLIGIDVTPAFSNFTSGLTVQTALEGIDTALGTVAGGDKYVKITASDTTASYLNSKLTAGSGLSSSITNPSGNEVLDLAVNVDGSTLEINADALRIKALGITNSHISASAAIAESKLALDYSTSSLNTAIGNKVSKSGDTMTGALNMGSNQINSLADGTSPQDAVTKSQMEFADGTKLNLSGGTLTGPLITAQVDVVDNTLYVYSSTPSTPLVEVTNTTVLVTNDTYTTATQITKDSVTVSTTGSNSSTINAGSIQLLTGGIASIPSIDADVATKKYVDDQDNLKLDLTGGTMSGNIAMGSNKLTGLSAGSSAGDSVRYEQAILTSGANAFAADQSMGGFKLTNIADGTLAQDAVSKSQMDTADGLRVAKAGDTMSGNLAMGGNLVTGLGAPVAANDAVRKAYVDALSAGSVWLSPIQDPDLIDDSLNAPPGSPVFGDVYIAGAAPTGAWAGFPGYAFWHNGAAWTDLLGRAVVVGDRFGVSMESATAAAGGLAGQENKIAQIATAVKAAAVIQDLTYTADGPGATGNAITVAYTTGATAGSEVVSVVGTAISVQIDSGNSTATQVKAAVDAFPAAAALVNVTISGTAGNAQTAPVSATNLASGAITYSYTTPATNQAVYVSNDISHHAGHQYNYNGSAWVEFGGLSAVNAGIGLAYSGNVLSVNLGAGISQLPTDEVGVDVHSSGGLMTTVDNSSSSTVTAAQLAVKLNGSSLAKSASGLEIAAGGITNSHINASAAIAYSKLDLASSIVNADINASAAIAYSKLNLSSSIVDADIAAAAAISLSKLAALTANRALQSDGSGVISASSVTNTELGYLSGVTSAIQTQLNDKASKALDNLASVAINTSLISDTDNTDDLGSDAIEWKDLWVHSIKHNSSGTPDLSISTTGNNGSLALTAHGTGNLDVKATKLRRSENGASSNFMEDQYFDGLSLAANTVAATEISSSLSFSVASFDSAVINYRIKEASSGKTRVGQFIVTSDGTISSSSDQFSETAALGAALGLSLSADIDSGNVRILYNNTHASNAATMRCHIRRLRA